MYYPLGVLLAIVVVAPSSLNPDTISDQKCHFNTRFQTRTLKSIPVSDSLWSAANFVNNQIYNFLSILLLKLWCHYKVVYLPYDQFWRSNILQIVHVSIFLNTAGPQNARNVLSENLVVPTPPTLQETSARAVVLVRLLVGTHSHRKKPGYGRGWG